MQPQFWVEMLRRIPAAFHESLVVATLTGVDIVLQSVVRLDDHFLVFKGRPSGSSDAGKLIVLPYHQINYLFFPGRLTEQQMFAMFGGADVNFSALPANVSVPTMTTQTAESAIEGPSPQNEGTSEETLPKPQHSKSMLLAKLRAKLGREGSKSPHQK